MKTSAHEELKKYPIGSLTKEAFVRIYKKKSVKLMVSGIMAFVSACLAEMLRSHGGGNLQFGDVLQFLIFAVLIISIAYFISNIGAFKKWKFITAGSVSAVLLWAIVPVIEVYTAIDLTQPGNIAQMVLGSALYYIPMFLMELGTVLIFGMLFFRKGDLT